MVNKQPVLQLQHANMKRILLPTLVLAATATTILLSVFSCSRRPYSNQTSTRITVSSTGSLLSNHSNTADTSAATVAAAWEIPFNPAATIPMQLWQTSRTGSFSNLTRWVIASWQKLNPGQPHYFHDDTEAANFVREFYGQEVFEAFRAFPLGVMRADFWRYAMLYAHGGVYGDIDTQCIKPIREWLPPRRNNTNESMVFVSNNAWKSPGGLDYYSLSWNDCSIVLGLENSEHFCQWIIASVAGHPILCKVVQFILERAKQGIDLRDEHFVHFSTGPGVWTEAVRKSLGFPGSMRAEDIATAVWTDPAAYRRAKALGVCIVAQSFWGGKRPQNARNLFGSVVKQFWADEYPSWRKEREALLGNHTVAENDASPFI